MNGRGRGRGGFGTPGSMRIDISRDTAQDLGVTGLTFSDGPPLLYPTVALPPPTQLTKDEEYIVSKSRDLIYRMRKSPFYQSSDIEKFYRTNENAADIRLYLTESFPGSHVPTELLDTKKSKEDPNSNIMLDIHSLTDPSKNADILLSLEEKEQSGKTGKRMEVEEGDEDEVESDLDDLDEDVDDDYRQDYYASEPESDGDF